MAQRFTLSGRNLCHHLWHQKQSVIGWGDKLAEQATQWRTRTGIPLIGFGAAGQGGPIRGIATHWRRLAHDDVPHHSTGEIVQAATAAVDHHHRGDFPTGSAVHSHRDHNLQSLPRLACPKTRRLITEPKGLLTVLRCPPGGVFKNREPGDCVKLCWRPWKYGHGATHTLASMGRHPERVVVPVLTISLFQLLIDCVGGPIMAAEAALSRLQIPIY